MAGNVSVVLEAGLLKIQGDNLDNQLTVTRAATGDLVITGQTETLINGQASYTLLNPTIGSVDIRMEGGADSLTIRGLQVAKSFFANLGDGADRLTTVAAGPTSIGGKLTIQGGLGNDVVRLERTTVRSDVKIDGGEGTSNTTIIDSTLNRSLTLLGHDVGDIVNIRNTDVALSALFNTKGGADRVTLTDFSALGVTINTDVLGGLSGADRVTLTRVETVEDLNLYTGAGNDIVAMTDVTSDRSIFARFDAGNDSLTMTRVSAAFEAIFDGSAGFDSAFYVSLFAGTNRDFIEFESVEAG
jgi:hypothetical protein